MVSGYIVGVMKESFSLPEVLVCIMLVLVLIGFIRVIAKRGSGQ